MKSERRRRCSPSNASATLGSPAAAASRLGHRSRDAHVRAGHECDEPFDEVLVGRRHQLGADFALVNGPGFLRPGEGLVEGAEQQRALGAVELHGLEGDAGVGRDLGE